jgi:hypothetical protein
MGMTAVKKYEEMLGETMASVTGAPGGDVMVFTSLAGDEFRFTDPADYSTVYLEDIVGDLGDLCGSPIVLAEAVSEDAADDGHDSATWTFLRYGTAKGTVTVRWFGSSNGYYAEEPYYSVRAVSREMKQKQKIDALESKISSLENWIRSCAGKYELTKLEKELAYVKGDVRPLLEKMGALRCTYTDGANRCTRPHGHWLHGSPEHTWERR